MAVTITVTCDSAVDTTVVHGPSGAALQTTAPADNGGDGSQFSPTDLVAAGTASCVLTIMSMKAKSLGLDLTGATATIHKEMAADPRRRIARLPMTIRIPTAVPADARPKLERAAHTCPVHETLRDRVDVPITFDWTDAEPDAGRA
jgi:putative redox protein